MEYLSYHAEEAQLNYLKKVQGVQNQCGIFSQIKFLVGNYYYPLIARTLLK